MIELTEEQRRALRTDGETPLRVVDPETSTAYVLIRADLYERMRAVLDDGLDMEQTTALVDKTMREYDANDPLLESYQKFRS